MEKLGKTGGKVTIGLDLGDKYCHYHTMSPNGDSLDEGRVKTTGDGLKARFQGIEPARIVIEAGTHSPWVSRLLEECGHEVLVANPRKLRLIYDNPEKDDHLDPEILARLGRVDPELLNPIQHREPMAQKALAGVRARDSLVKARTQLVNHVRGAVKSFGGRVTGCSTHNFHETAMESIPEELRRILHPVIKVIAELTEQIHEYDKAIEKDLCEKRYPVTKMLQQVSGVGPVTALTFTLILADPLRFKKSRDVGAYLGLTPRRHSSGERNPQLGISKAGDTLLRRLLVGSAHYILGPFGPDSDLRRHGEAIAQRGGKNAKKRAVVAVARKLAVLLHKLWLTGEVYEPLRNSSRQRKRSASVGGVKAEKS